MNWQFKLNCEPVGTSNGIWYDLTDGGYIEPEMVLSDVNQIEQLRQAIALVKRFEEALEAQELLNEF